jgi:hypothetical protein
MSIYCQLLVKTLELYQDAFLQKESVLASLWHQNEYFSSPKSSTTVLTIDCNKGVKIFFGLFRVLNYLIDP